MASSAQGQPQSCPKTISPKQVVDLELQITIAAMIFVVAKILMKMMAV